MSKYINLSLRVSASGAKFLYLLLITKYAEWSDVGLFGVLSAMVSLIVLMVGVDFYVHANRELMLNVKNKQTIITTQAALYLSIYIIFAPLIILYYLWLTDFPTDFAYMFCLWIVLEHLNIEIYRALIALEKQLKASIILCIKQILPVVILLFAIFFTNYEIDYISAVTILFLPLLVAGVLGIYFLQIDLLDLSCIDLSFVKGGIKISIIMIISTFFLRYISTMDKTFVLSSYGVEKAGIYTILFSISMIISIVYDAVFSSYVVQKLVRLGGASDPPEFHRYFKEISWQSMNILIISFLIVAVIIYPVIVILEKPEIFLYLKEYVALCALALAFCHLSLTSMGLIALKRDFVNLVTNLLMFLVFIVITNMNSTNMDLLDFILILISIYAVAIFLKNKLVKFYAFS